MEPRASARSGVSALGCGLRNSCRLVARSNLGPHPHPDAADVARSWIVGLAPEAGRFFFYWFMLFWFHQFAVALFRLMGAALRPLTLANAGSVFFSMGVMTFGEHGPHGLSDPDSNVAWQPVCRRLQPVCAGSSAHPACPPSACRPCHQQRVAPILTAHGMRSTVIKLISLHTNAAGGYIEPKHIIPGWWIWAYWINPMSWAQQSLAINEFKCASAPIAQVHAGYVAADLCLVVNE